MLVMPNVLGLTEEIKPKMNSTCINRESLVSAKLFRSLSPNKSYQIPIFWSDDPLAYLNYQTKSDSSVPGFNINLLCLGKY